jgi:hypothetical protein
MNGWATVFDISARRHNTKQGMNHLTDHAAEVLQAFAQNEAANAMRDAIMGEGEFSFMFVIPE